MIGDALENVVSAFDGFGRVISRERGIEVRFQNLSGARRNVIEKFGFDFADGLTLDDWEFICRTFRFLGNGAVFAGSANSTDLIC